MTMNSTKSMGQHAAILRTHEDNADEIQGGQIQDAKKRPLKLKNLRSAQGAFDAPMG
jgi:ribosomal protein L14E/L6E/L27E